jgi:hypothetical protein
MLYRKLRQRASGDGARRGRLTGFLAEVSRQAVWYGSRQSAECWVGGCARGGRRPGLAVGRSLVTKSTSLIHARRDSAVRELVVGGGE